MENRFHAVEEEPDAGAAPFRTFSSKRDQESFDFRPTKTGWNRTGKNRLERAPMLGVHVMLLPQIGIKRQLAVLT